MGIKESIEWEEKRDPGCACPYCSHSFYTYNKPKGQTLYVWPSTNRLKIGPPGCWGDATWESIDDVWARRAQPSGCVCFRCNNKNEFAEPNQKDGRYLCFECR